MGRVRWQETCVWSGDKIETDNVAVSIRSLLGGKDIGGNNHIALSSLQELQQRFGDFDAERYERGDSLSPTGYVKYTTNRGERYHKDRACTICERQIEMHDEVIEFNSQGMYGPRIHIDCLDEFVEALDRVWEYSDGILKSNL